MQTASEHCQISQLSSVLPAQAGAGCLQLEISFLLEQDFGLSPLDQIEDNQHCLDPDLAPLQT